MRIVWTDAAIDHLEEILDYYYVQAGPRIAGPIERRIVEQIEALLTFPERIRKGDRIPDARELVLNKLPYIVFVKLFPDSIVVLNVIHTARKFPA